MMEWIPDHLRVYLVVGGLLLLLLLVASLIHKYEQYQASRRLAVQRILSVTRSIESALEGTRGVGLPPGLGKLLRNELLARYFTVHQIYPRYPGINPLVAQAEERARSEPEGQATPNSTAVTSQEVLNRYVAGSNEILRLLHGNLLAPGLGREARAVHQVKLVEFQLLAAHQFHSRHALEMAGKGEWYKAQRAIRALESFIHSRPGATPQTARLRAEARQMMQALSEQRIPNQPAAGHAVS